MWLLMVKKEKEICIRFVMICLNVIRGNVYVLNNWSLYFLEFIYRWLLIFVSFLNKL